jgi:hypothetical protein
MILKIFKDIARYNNMDRLYSVETILLTKITNSHVEARRGKVLDLPIQRASCCFTTIYSIQLRETKDSLFFNKIIKDIFLRWER